MDKKYLAQIIATDNEGLQMISACTAGAKVKVADIKYLSSNKLYLPLIKSTNPREFFLHIKRNLYFRDHNLHI